MKAMRTPVFIGLLALLPWGSPARGLPPPPPPGLVDVEVVTGPDGALGQWLITAPVMLPGAGRRTERLRGSPFAAGVGAAVPGRPVPIAGSRTVGWRLASSARRTLDVRALTKLPAWRTQRTALLGLVLEATREERGWLSIGYDDGLEVWLNGRRLLEDLHPGTLIADARLVPLALKQGRNRLVLRLAHGRGRWRIRARLTGPDHAALGTGSTRGVVRLKLPLPRAAARRITTTVWSLRERVQRRITPQGITFSVGFDAPAGAVLPPGGRLTARLRVGRGPAVAHILDLRSLASSTRGWRVALPWRGGRRKSLRWRRWDLPNRKTVGGPLWRAATLCRRLLDAEGRLARLPATTASHHRETVAFHLLAVRRLLEQGDRDQRHLTRRLWWARRWVDALARGKDPFRRARGRLVLAHRSAVDGTLQPYSLYVPRGYRGRRPWPLYVMLHGMNGNHREGLHLMLGTWLPKSDPTPWWKWLRRPSPIRVHPRALVLAPQGHGNAFYQHAGEVDVLRAIEAVRRRYRVDPSRIVLVGHSMGGTGVLDLGLRYPSLFAGAVSLAGYPTRWIHRSIRKGPLASWESFQARLLSPVTWSRNGRHLPLIAVHGKKDGPWKSTLVVKRWKRLRQPAELKLFEGGHDVWRKYLDAGQVYRDTRGWRRPSAPRRVTFGTPRLRWNRAWWVRILERDRSDARAEVDARAYRGNRLRLTTKNVTALRLRPGPRWRKPGRDTTITIDGRALTVPDRTPLDFHRGAAGWRLGAPTRPAGLVKRPGLEGPMDDLHHGPVMVVVGTRDPTQTRALARVGRSLRRHLRADVRYPLKTDRQVTANDRKRYHLILVGAAHANAETARYAARLPVRITRREIQLGKCRYTGADVGSQFIHPNPDAPDRYLLVLAGTTAEGVLRAHRLPRYLPDFVVFDRTIEQGRTLRILGPGRRFRAAGFFDGRWRVPGGLPCDRPSAPTPRP